MAKMIGCGAICSTRSAVRAPLTDRPMKTSAPARASASVRLSVSTAWADFHWFMSSVRPRHRTPTRSTAMTLSGRTPMALISSSVAMPAAPGPFSTTFTSLMSRPLMAQALIRPAAQMIAVPCWSSWNTGMVEQLLQLGLDAEALGALDVLEVDAAEGDADVLDDGDDLVGIGGRDLDVDGVDVGEALEEHPLALHHRLGGERAEIAQAQDGRAIGDHRYEIAFGGVVVGRLRILVDLQHRHGDARRIGQRQIPLGGHRLGGNDGDLARGGQAVETQRLLVGEGAFLGVAHRAREILTGCGGGMSGLTLPLRQGRNNLATPRMKVPAGH
jgi:hypothetical protein